MPKAGSDTCSAVTSVDSALKNKMKVYCYLFFYNVLHCSRLRP